MENNDNELETPTPIINWTNEEKTTFKEIWKVLSGESPEDLRKLGVKLLLWMFDSVEGIKEVFENLTQTSIELFEADERFLRHTQSVIVALDNLVKQVADDKIFEEGVRQLMQQHLKNVDPPVTSIYFESLRDKFHLFVKKMTGLPSDSDPSIMWYQFLDVLVKVCKEEEAVLEKRNKTMSENSSICCSVL